MLNYIAKHAFVYSSELKTSIQGQIVNATHLLNRGAINKDYQNEFELQEYVDTFRKVIQIARKQFRMHQPHNPKIHHIPSKLPHNNQTYAYEYDEEDELELTETKPLIDNNNPFHPNYDNAYDQNNYYQSQSLRFDVDDETKTLEDDEEKMAYITDEISEVRDMLINLDGVIDDGQQIVDYLEDKVEASKNDVLSGADHLIKAEKNLKKIRCNRCICLIGLIAIVTCFLLYLWITTRHR